ncbi:hypothetical protein [Amycolatopsis rubida]|uniref:Uncharacterized protein n=1 Tax=Amycolatopsis rubida TaxID=112413 RepID=A0A1I5ZG96_9PSEU|nr:hypothetical protein [Amycolatopsis rubida]SFQ55137.1 hypothetical protein SAMN05421854_11515 [Amycolatopsis rubida]
MTAGCGDSQQIDGILGEEVEYVEASDPNVVASRWSRAVFGNRHSIRSHT